MFELPVFVLLIISIIGYTATTGLNGVYSRRFPTIAVNIWRNSFLQNLACTATLILIYAVSDTTFKVSAFSALLGMLYSSVIILALLFTLKAQSQGAFAYTTVIVALSAVIPSISGALFFNEKITFYQIIGILMMIVCIILSPEKSKKSENSLNVKWLLYSFLAFCATGFIGLIQKIHQSSAVHKDEMPIFLLVAFVTGSIVSGIVVAIITPRYKKDVSSAPLPKSAFVLPIVSGCCLALPHTVNLFLSGVLPSILFFPTVNLCPMMLNMLTSVFLFREKLSLRQWIGIFFGILSTVFVSGVLGG